MIARLGYRRLLPTANILLFAILLSIGYVGNRSADAYQQGLEIAHSAQAEGWQPTYIERPTPLTHLFAWSLNFPAMLFATPFGLLAKGWRAELLINGIAAVYLLVLWFIVGLWWDHRRDPSRPVHKTRPLQIVRWIAFVVASAAFLLVVAVIIARIMLHQYPETVCTVPMLFWPLFLAYAALWEIRRSRSLEQAKAAVA